MQVGRLKRLAGTVGASVFVSCVLAVPAGALREAEAEPRLAVSDSGESEVLVWELPEAGGCVGMGDGAPRLTVEELPEIRKSLSWRSLSL